MKMKKILQNEKAKLSKIDELELQKILKFESRGYYYDIGRTCYYKLNNPVCIDNINYSYIKIKGAGALNENKQFIIPGTGIFVRRDKHFSIGKDGYSDMIASDIAPYGGITISRAINEYNNFTKLTRTGVSSLLPYAVFIYDNLLLEKEYLGISTALCESNEPLRMSKLLYSDEYIPDNYKKFYKKIYELNFGVKTNLDFYDKSKLINKIAYLYAKEIRKFGESGLFIHSGGWSNIQYSFEKNNVVLVDLDSSRPIFDKKLSRLLQYRDLISNIYRLYINLYNPKCIKEYNEDIIYETNYVLSLLKGYFSKVDDKKLAETADLINNYYIVNCFNSIKVIENIMHDMSDEECKKYELDILNFYDYCLKKLDNISSNGEGYYLGYNSVRREVKKCLK